MSVSRKLHLVFCQTSSFSSLFTLDFPHFLKQVSTLTRKSKYPRSTWSHEPLLTVSGFYSVYTSEWCHGELWFELPLIIGWCVVFILSYLILSLSFLFFFLILQQEIAKIRLYSPLIGQCLLPQPHNRDIIVTQMEFPSKRTSNWTM